MKKVLFALFFFLVFNVCICQTARIDTIYYDKDWKNVAFKEFADYYRVILFSNDNLTSNRFRDYYITGELQGEGSLISLDGLDDKNTIFDGEIVSYYKNGNKHSVFNYSKGSLNGRCTEYFENGLVEREMTMKNGEIDGLYTEFNDDGSAMQMNYSNGRPAQSYYYYTSKEGLISKISLRTQDVYWEDLPLSERKTIYRNGTAWQYYVQNNLMVALTNTTVRDYGRWHRIDIIITNNSIIPIEFDPTEIGAVMTDNSNKRKSVKVWSCDEYMRKVRRNQNWTAAMVGFAEGMATANAGRTTSTTTSNTYYHGYSNTYGNASAYGSNGSYASGSYSGYGNYSGNSFNTTTTNSYDASAAYQTRVLSQQRLAAFEAAQWQERVSKNEGYLKKTVVYPGESVSGYVLVERKNGQMISFYLPVCGISYEFDWSY